MQERGCGCGSGIAAIIIMMVAAIVGVGYYQWHSAVEERAARAREERQQLLDRHFAMVRDDLEEAKGWLQDGDPRLLVSTLKHMDEKLQMIAAGISQTGDSERLARIIGIRAAVDDAIEAIEDADDDDEALNAARIQLEDLQKAFDREPDSTAEDA
ncbi:MAG: hypothetical protein GF393_10580 [Armatimonadia bacterium]|nr:hypothetical protein [Armatimonadia bacterium]